MIALRVTLNGKPVCTAGAEDLAVLTTIVSAGGNLGPQTKRQKDEPPDLRVIVGGLTGRYEGSDEHLRWLEDETLRIGDRVEIELLETSVTDKPIESRPFDLERQLTRERSQFEYAKEMYLLLRPKFEPEKGARS